MNIYESCPKFENEKFILRLVEDGDTDNLLTVYSDEKAVPFFNGDNCHGDDFHYTTRERMCQALDFWKQAYQNGWFVRWAIIDKRTSTAVGTIEEFHRDAEDYFTDCGLLRLDLRSDYEKSDEIESILSLIINKSFELFGCSMIATKAVGTATERRKALQKLSFKESDEKLIGFDGTQYGSYFVLKK